MEIRTYTGTDSEGMIDLWKCAGLVHPANDPHRDIDRKMSDSPWEFLVAVDNGEIVGSVMVGYEGHRGWINHLACHPDRRRTGIAAELMTAARQPIPRGIHVVASFTGVRGTLRLTFPTGG